MYSKRFDKRVRITTNSIRFIIIQLQVSFNKNNNIFYIITPRHYGRFILVHCLNLEEVSRICLETGRLKVSGITPITLNCISSGLALDAALKMTEVKLELLTDIDMHMFVESGIRGGIAVITHRHVEANLPQFENYDPSQPNQHLIYLDSKLLLLFFNYTHGNIFFKKKL